MNEYTRKTLKSIAWITIWIFVVLTVILFALDADFGEVDIEWCRTPGACK